MITKKNQLKKSSKIFYYCIIIYEVANLKRKTIIFILSLLLLLIPIKISANENINIYVFHNYNCKYCQKALDYFHDVTKKDSSIHLYDYELLEDNHAYNRTLYNKITSLLSINKQAVPLIIIGNDYLIGFSPLIQEEIKKKLAFCKENEYQDLVGINLGIIDENNNYLINRPNNKEYNINTIFGKISLSKNSLFISTLILSIINSFNVYAIIGIVLLLLILNINNKRSSWILFLSYIGCYTFIYFINLMAWFNINDYLNIFSLLKTGIIIFSTTLVFINLYHYINKKETNYLNKKSLFLPITGVIILATINSLLFILKNNSNSLLFIELLNSHNLVKNSFIRYIIFYLFFFNITSFLFMTINIILNKKILTKLENKTSLIKAIIFFIIVLVLLIV